MKHVIYVAVAMLISISGYTQTWLEKANNGLNFGTNNPPSSVNVNDYSEPFDTSWRRGFTGIGTALWPKTRLQVHSNANVDTELDNFVSSLGGYNKLTSITSNGGTNQDSSLAIASLHFTSRSNVNFAENIGSAGYATGDNLKNNIGVAGLGFGNNCNQLQGVNGITFGDNLLEYGRGVFGEAGGNGANQGNFGVWGQCRSTDANSVNVGVYGIGAAGCELSLINIGVHGETRCDTCVDPSGGSQFNCGVYGENAGCYNTTSSSNGSYPTGNYAGYFDGDVYITGSILPPSDKKLKENINSIENVMDRLSKVNIYSYTFKQNTGLSLPRGKKYGVLSQELEQHFPELVKDATILKHSDSKSYRNFETVKSVEYMGFIPLLIQSVKELNEKITALDPTQTTTALATLKEQIAALERNMQTAAIDNQVDVANYINAYPNPSSQSMTIDIKNVSCRNCVLMITDLSGKLIKQINLENNSQQIILQAADYAKGIYQCNLVAEGKVLSGIRIAFTQ